MYEAYDGGRAEPKVRSRAISGIVYTQLAMHVFLLVLSTPNTVQNRLSRCAQQCDDECRDMVPSNAQQKDIDRVEKHAEQCLMKCADDNIKRIPQLITRFRESLGRTNYSKKW